MITRDFARLVVQAVLDQQSWTPYGTPGAALLILASILIASPMAPKQGKAPEEAKDEKVHKDAKGRRSSHLWWVALLLFLLVIHP
ncbi:hypothetical protein ACIQPR_04170 [Streptomyces sp. NPDC091280]|uniref:hypothetical protein n=1 Tax=Streptomyces sp. NPDC091280 TaxID=3365984 RepID=UPI0037FEBDB7